MSLPFTNRVIINLTRNDCNYRMLNLRKSPINVKCDEPQLGDKWGFEPVFGWGIYTLVEAMRFFLAHKFLLKGYC